MTNCAYFNPRLLTRLPRRFYVVAVVGSPLPTSVSAFELRIQSVAVRVAR